MEEQNKNLQVDVEMVKSLSGLADKDAMEAASMSDAMDIAESQDVDVNAIKEMSNRFIDPITGAEIPLEASGVAPALAINESPLSLEDRLKLSLGNKAGKLSYLKSKFEDATEDAFGNLTVQKDGLWYKVDQEGAGIDDWTSTKQWLRAGKELAADMADIAPELAAVGVGFGVGAVTGGAGLPVLLAAETAAGGGLAALRTSLGRLAGTYKADAEQQFQDIAFESLLSMGGTAVLAGVKPAGKFMANQIPKLHAALKAINEVPESAGKGLGKFFAKNSVGLEAYDVLLENPKGLQKTILAAETAAKEIPGDSGAAFVQAIQEAQLDDVFNFAKQAKSLEKTLYKNMEKQILNTAGEEFVDPSATAGLSAAIDAIQSGLSTLKVRANIDGKAVWQKVKADRAVKILLEKAEAGSPLNSKMFKLEAPSLFDLKQMARNGVNIDSGVREILNSPEAASALQRLNADLSFSLTGRQIKGGQAVKAAIQNNRSFKNNLNEVKKLLSESGAKTAASKVSEIGNRFSSAMTNNLDEATNGLYSQLNKEYSLLKQNLDPLAAMAQASPEKSMKAAQTYLGQISSTRNSGILARKGLREAISAAENLDKGTAARLKDLQKNIELKQAALMWNPVTKKDPTQLAIGGYAIMSQNAPLLGAIALKGASTSRGLLKGTTQTTQLAWRQLNFLRALDPKARQSFLNLPQNAAAAALGATTYFRNDGEPEFMYNVPEEQ